MTYDFSGKTAVVTGASRGLGAAIAQTLADDGARVIMLARSEKALNDIAANMPNNPVVIPADFAKPDSAETAAKDILAISEDIDILVNNAGVGVVEDMNNLTQDGLDFTFNVNVRNLILLTGQLTPALMKARGNIVNISSVSSFSGGLGQVAYAASKGAINSFTRNASIDLGRSGVRVNAVAPGVIDDGMWKTAFESGVDRETTMKKMRRLLPLEGRWGSAQNVADAVAWLASDKAGYVTGQVIRVDGGMIV